MIHLRKLAAIDILFLGHKFVVAEYAAGVLLSPALGLFALYRSHSTWQIVLGIYLICLGINYIPMLVYTFSIADKESAKAELGSELSDKGAANVQIPSPISASFRSTRGPHFGRAPHPSGAQPFPSGLNPICRG
jgi:hypothetical protein